MKDADRQSQTYRNVLCIPKVELHVHFEGSLRPQTLLKLSKKYDLPFQYVSEESLYLLYRYRRFEDFVKALMFGVGMLRQPEDFFDAMMDLGGQLLADNVRYAEVTWTPQLYLNRSFPLDAILDALNQARHRLEKESGLKIGWIPDLVRSYPSPSLKIAQWVAQKRQEGSGIVALGLGGPEHGWPASNFSDAFALAKAHGLPINPHAGETSGPGSIWETILATSPKRIGHGVRAAEDPILLSYLSKHSIVLEVCLSSNVGLGIYSSLATHSLRQLMNAGISVVLNTDDRALFQTNLTDEYFLAMTQAGLSFEEVSVLARTSIDHSYLSLDEKEALFYECGYLR